MPLIRSKSALIIESINKENPNLPQELTRNNCFLYGFQYVDSKKARCLVKGRFGSGIRGSVWVTYNKLDVDILTRECERDIVDAKGSATLDYLPLINQRYGFDLKPEEIKNHTVLNDICRLEVQPESTIFCGSVDLKIVAPKPDIGQLIGPYSYDVAFDKYPAVDAVNGFVLTACHDYSNIGEVLFTQPTGVLDVVSAEQLATELTSVDGVPWGIVDATLYSLVGANVTYNGTVAEYPESELKTDVMYSKFEYVMTIAPSETTIGLSDQPIVVHYNLYQNERS